MDPDEERQLIDAAQTRVEARLRSMYYTPNQLMALGRIAELSALLEALLRRVLEQVLGLSRAAGDALFLGDRTSTLVARIKELGTFADMPRWFSEDAVDWAKRVNAAITLRDNLMHRAPVMLHSDDDDDAEPVIGWNRARRAHKVMPIDNDQLLDAIERLASLEHEAMNKLFWGEWESSVSEVVSPDSPSTDIDTR